MCWLLHWLSWHSVFGDIWRASLGDCSSTEAAVLFECLVVSWLFMHLWHLINQVEASHLFLQSSFQISLLNEQPTFMTCKWYDCKEGHLQL